jgi:hypothetical protein
MGVSLHPHKEKWDRSVRKVTGYKVDNQTLNPSRDRNSLSTDSGDHIVSILVITHSSFPTGKESSKKDMV